MHCRPAGTQWKERPTKHTCKASETQRGPTNQCDRSGCAKISKEQTDQRSAQSIFGTFALFLTEGCAPGGLFSLVQAHVCFCFSAKLQKLQVKKFSSRLLKGCGRQNHSETWEFLEALRLLQQQKTIRTLCEDQKILLKTFLMMAPYYTLWQRNCNPPYTHTNHPPHPHVGFFRFSLWSLGPFCPCRWKPPLPPIFFQRHNTSWACGCIRLRFISSTVPKQTTDKERHTSHSIGLKPPPAAEAYRGGLQA